MRKLLVCLIIAAFTAAFVPSAAAEKPGRAKPSATKSVKAGKARVAAKANNAPNAGPKKAPQSKRLAKSTRSTRTGGTPAGRVSIKGGKSGKVLHFEGKSILLQPRKGQFLHLGRTGIIVPPGVTVEGYGDTSHLTVERPKHSARTQRNKSH